MLKWLTESSWYLRAHQGINSFNLGTRIMILEFELNLVQILSSGWNFAEFLIFMMSCDVLSYPKVFFPICQKVRGELPELEYFQSTDQSCFIFWNVIMSSFSRWTYAENFGLQLVLSNAVAPHYVFYKILDLWSSKSHVSFFRQDFTIYALIVTRQDNHEISLVG